MKDLTYCGPVPANEDCEQVGPNYRPEVAREECVRYRDQLRAQFGPEPEGASLRIKSQPHDFGSYLEVVCSYDDSNEKAVDYAFACESDSWPDWKNCAECGERWPCSMADSKAYPPPMVIKHRPN